MSLAISARSACSMALMRGSDRQGRRRARRLAFHRLHACRTHRAQWTRGDRSPIAMRGVSQHTLNDRSARARLSPDSLSTARISWASSMSRPIPFPMAASMATPAVAIAHGNATRGARAPTFSISAANRPGPARTPSRMKRNAARILPVIAALAASGHRISVDTRKASVMAKAAPAGAALINDVSALGHDPASLADRGEARPARGAHACQGRSQDHAGQSRI